MWVKLSPEGEGMSAATTSQDRDAHPVAYGDCSRVAFCSIVGFTLPQVTNVSDRG